MFCCLFEEEIMFYYLEKEKKKDRENLILTNLGTRKINFMKNTPLNILILEL